MARFESEGLRLREAQVSIDSSFQVLVLKGSLEAVVMSWMLVPLGVLTLRSAEDSEPEGWKQRQCGVQL